MSDAILGPDLDAFPDPSPDYTSESWISYAKASLRRQAVGLPEPAYRYVPARQFDREELLMLCALLMRAYQREQDLHWEARKKHLKYVFAQTGERHTSRWKRWRL